MSQQSSGTPPQQGQLSEPMAKVARLLRELEPTLSDDQHALLTHLFAERAVLNAMRASIAGQPETTNS